MSDIPHVEGEVVNDISAREVSSKVDTKAQLTQEVLTKATKLFMQLAANPLIRNTVSQAALQEATKLVVSYDNKFGPGAAKNSTELLREISKVIGGDQNRATEILDAVYKALPSVEQVTKQNSEAFPSDELTQRMIDMARVPKDATAYVRVGSGKTTSEQALISQETIEGPNVVMLSPAANYEPNSSNGGPVIVDTVTAPAPIEPSDEDISERARQFASEMLQDRTLIFNPRDLDEAVNTAKKEDVTSLEAFKGHVLKVVNEAARKEEEKKRLAQAAKSSLERWEAEIKTQHPDVQDFVQKKLNDTYNLPEGMIGVFDVQLGAYTMPGLANKKGTLRDELNMDAYSNPVFAILRNMESESVRAAVYHSIEAMDSADFTAQVNAIVESSSLTVNGTLEEKRTNLIQLANDLPQLKGKVAPDNYKIWYLLTRSSVNNTVPTDMTSRIYAQTQDAINHQARTETYMASGIPQAPAMDIAYRESVQDIEEEEAKKRGLLDTAGRIIGTVAATPARCKKSIQDAMYEAMGEYGEEWKANQEAAKERKRLLKEQKAQQDFELAQKELELKTQMMAQQNMQKMMNAQSPYVNGAYRNQTLYGTNTRRNGRQVHNGNFAPHVPMPVIATLIHIVVALVCWLIYGNVAAVYIAVGLVVATVGLFSYKSKGSKAILTAVAGYLIVVIAILLS